MIKIACPAQQHLLDKGRSGILDCVSRLIISNLEIYFDLDFFETKIVKTSDESVYVVLKKDILYLPELSSSIQKISFHARNGRATILTETRSNPSHYEGFPDCINDLADTADIIQFVQHISKQHRLIGELNFVGGSEFNYVTILDKISHFNVFLRRDDNEGRYSIHKTTAEVTGLMHTLLKQKKH